MNNFAAVVSGVLAVAIWASIPSLVKLGGTADNFLQLLVLRFVIGSLVLLPVHKEVIKKVRQVPLRSFVLLSIVLGANYYFQTVAMQALPASWYIVIFSLNPILALGVLRLKLNRRILLATGVSFIGTLLFVQAPDFDSHFKIFTVVSLFIGMATWVLYTGMIADFQKVYSDLETTALTQVLALASLLLIWAQHGFSGATLENIPWQPVLILGLSTPLAYFCFSYCLRRLPVFCVLSQYLEPVIGVALGMLLFGEQLAPVQIVGAAAIVAGTARMAK